MAGSKGFIYPNFLHTRIRTRQNKTAFGLAQNADAVQARCRPCRSRRPMEEHEAQVGAVRAESWPDGLPFRSPATSSSTHIEGGTGTLLLEVNRLLVPLRSSRRRRAGRRRRRARPEATKDPTVIIQSRGIYVNIRGLYENIRIVIMNHDPN